MRCIVLFLCSLLMALLPRGEAQNPGMALNREGWNMPDTKKLIHVKDETVDLPGIKEEIATERWNLPKGSPYRITAFYPWQSGPVSEEVGWLVIYRAPDDKILCYEYGRFLRVKKTGEELGGTLSFFTDLDDDGRYESQFDDGGEIKNRLLLASIIRVKLGTSEETDLVLRVIEAALRDRPKQKNDPQRLERNESGATK